MLTIVARCIVVAAGILFLPSSGGAQDRPGETASGEVQIKEASPSNSGLKPKPDMNLKPKLESDKAQPVGSSAERDPGPNYKPFGKPDLIVTTAECGGWCPFLGLYVENVGFGPSTATSISLTCKPSNRNGPNNCARIPSSVAIHELPMKQSNDQNFQFVMQIPQSVKLSAKVDPYYKVDESNEYNNAWTSESNY